jgi:hypothetical protein
MISARVAEVQDRLRRRAYARREEFSAVFSWFLAEGLALRLARHERIRDQILLSGDLMLYSSLGGEAPFEWQVELLATEPVITGGLAQRFRDVCGVEVDDGLEFELQSGGGAGPVEVEGGRCFVVNLIGRLGSIALPLPVVVRVDEQFRQKPCDYFFGPVLGGAVTARVLTCPPTVLVALRLRAAVCLGAAPTGMKALWDLYKLITSGKVDSSLAVGAVADAFRGRGAGAARSVPLLLSQDFAANASRQQVWAAFLKRARVEAPVLSDVVRSVQREAWPWLVQGVSGAVS